MSLERLQQSITLDALYELNKLILRALTCQHPDHGLRDNGGRLYGCNGCLDIRKEAGL